MALWLILFRLSLDFMYMFIIRKEYGNITLLLLGYQRGAFSFNTDPARIFVSFVLSVGFIIFVTLKIVKDDKAHELITLGLLATSVLPNHVMFAYSEIEWRFIILHTLFWGWMFFLTYKLSKKDSTNVDTVDKGIKITKESARYTFWIIAFVFIIGSIILSYKYYGGFHIDLRLDNDTVYTNRIAARGAFGYLTNLFRNNAMLAVLPLLVISFLERKKYIYFAISLFAVFLLYSVDSFKIVLLLTIVSIIAALVIKKRICRTIVYGLVVADFFVTLIYELTGRLVLVEYLAKRIYFIPSIIGSCYYTYSNTHGIQLFFFSLLKKIGIISEYVYSEISLPFLIGRDYFGSVNISANTGGFGNAYAYGIIGLVLIPIMYATMFKILDRVTNGMNPKYYISFVILNIYVIVNTSIMTVLIIYGFITGIVMLSIMSRIDVFNKR